MCKVKSKGLRQGFACINFLDGSSRGFSRVVGTGIKLDYYQATASKVSGSIEQQSRLSLVQQHSRDKTRKIIITSIIALRLRASQDPRSDLRPAKDRRSPIKQALVFV